jgi:4-alpha-glucanotransferase
METPGSTLDRMARAAHVATSYVDAFGETQTIAPEAVQGVLAALGAEHESAGRPARLEPVYILEAGRDTAITLALSPDDERRAAGQVRWCMIAEDGTIREGAASIDALPVIDRLPIDGVHIRHLRLELDPTLDLGYYAFEIRAGTLRASTTVVMTPARCALPEAVSASPVWGLSVQLYGLRSKRNWGIGDFTDLRDLCDMVWAAGGAAVGINPLHLVRFGGTTVPSPYSPSSRAFVNWIYLDVEALPGYDARDVDAARIETARASEHVDYAFVANLKRDAARAAFERFARAHAKHAAFDAFVDRGGEALRRAAIFDALATHFEKASSTSDDWGTWPAPYRDPASDEVAAFAVEHARDLRFFAFLQWQADEQLARCAPPDAQCIGLYRDLAVGSGLGGSDTWALGDSLTRALAIGAPPDILNPRGQNWGVAPFDPNGLRAAAYAPFAELLRANMRHAGALRIDHVMALARLWLMPADAAATDGAYVEYPLDELLGILALESVRAGCLIVGEDLGTVPAGFRERLAEKRILSYRLLQFEVDDDGFTAPSTYPWLALVATGTHDLPPMGAYWTAHDVTLRAELSLIADHATERREREDRARKRDGLLESFDRELGTDAERTTRFREAAADPHASTTLAEIALAANRYLAKTPSRLLMVQLEDVLGDARQLNVPTTLDEHPNWRRRAAIALEELASDARFVALARALEPERARGNVRS